MTPQELEQARHRRRIAVLRADWRGFPAVPKPRPGVTIVGLWAHGGITCIHDYLMSDGSIATMRDDEAVDCYLAHQADH